MAPGRRMLLLAPELFSSRGGIPRVLRAYLLALSKLAVETGGSVRLLALNDPSLDAAELRRYTIGDLEQRCACNRSKHRFFREALRLGRGCDTLVCGHVAQLPVAWLVRRLNPRLRYYAVAHGLEVWRPFTPVEKIALRGAETIFCISEFTRRELLAHCPLREGRAVVLHNALDPHFEIGPGRPLRDCPPVILTVTRLSYNDRYKGVEHLILAMPDVAAAEPSARLRILGTGDDVPRLQGLARGRGLLGGTVEFAGAVDDKRLVEELGSCRLFALPSRKEGFGLVFLEAMAHGRPCLGARAGGIPEVISAETGLLVEFGDVPGLARACLAGLRRDWNQEAILERARKFSFEPFKRRLGELLVNQVSRMP